MNSENNENIEIGRRIKLARLANNLAGKEAAAKLQSTKSSISLYESGKRTPTLKVLKTISIEYGVTIDYLIFGNKKSLDKDSKITRYILVEELKLKAFKEIERMNPKELSQFLKDMTAS